MESQKILVYNHIHSKLANRIVQFVRILSCHLAQLTESESPRILGVEKILLVRSF